MDKNDRIHIRYNTQDGNTFYTYFDALATATIECMFPGADYSYLAIYQGMLAWDNKVWTLWGYNSDNRMALHVQVSDSLTPSSWTAIEVNNTLNNSYAYFAAAWIGLGTDPNGSGFSGGGGGTPSAGRISRARIG